MDSRFKYASVPTWNKQGKTQKLLGIDLVHIQASTPSTSIHEFELPTNSVLLFGPGSGFRVNGVFESRESPTTAAPDTKWDVVSAADYANVVVQPNWFEHLVKSVDVFHNNDAVKSHDVPRNVDAFVNTYIYTMMDPTVKKCLCPEASNPGNAVSIPGDKKWTSTANSAWHEYSKGIFKGQITFRYIPPFVFPFYQQSNFCGHGRPPAALPMPILEKMTVSMTMNDSFTNIFQKPATNTKQYRFRIKKMELVVQAARLNPSFERTFLSQQGTLYYPGVTKFSLTENIPAGAFSHRCRFQDIPYPEGMFIFALPKNVVGGQYKYSAITGTDSSIFSKHNIDSVVLQFQNKYLALKSPNIYGSLTDHMVEIKQLIDHLEHPPFGVLQKLDLLKLDTIKEGGKDSDFPHYYINLCPSGPETRVVPIGDDGSSINKPGDLDVEIKFKDGGAQDVAYFIYIFYTDVSILLDMKSHKFYPFYKRSRPIN